MQRLYIERFYLNRADPFMILFRCFFSNFWTDQRLQRHTLEERTAFYAEFQTLIDI